MLIRIFRAMMAVLAILTGLYPLVYFFAGRQFGLLRSKSAVLLSSFSWNTEFYLHIVCGGIALLVGWLQFNTKLREQRLHWHRQIGKLYVIAALLSSEAGVFIGFSATGGVIASAGFISLGVIWFVTTLKAYLAIRKRHIDEHRYMMIYSYAACLAAVTLRIYYPLLIWLMHDSLKAYLLVAWLCWVPNMAVAFYLVKGLQKQKAITAAY